MDSIGTAFVLGQPQMNATNETVFYVIGAAVLVGAVLFIWRLYKKSKLAAGHHGLDKRRPR